MGLFLQKGFQRFEILEWYETRSEDSFKEFWDKFSAIAFLNGFLNNTFNMVSLRTLAGKRFCRTKLSRLNDFLIIDQVARCLVSGQLKCLALPLEMPGWGSVEPVIKEKEEENEKIQSVPVVPLSLTNARWSLNVARVGDVVGLSADVKGYESGTNAVFEIFEMDIGGKDDFITKINAFVQGNKVESEWTYNYIEDTDDVSEEDVK